MTRLESLGFELTFDAAARIQQRGARATASRPVDGSLMRPDADFLAYGLALAVLRSRREPWPADASHAGKVLANDLIRESPLNIVDLAASVPL